MTPGGIRDRVRIRARYDERLAMAGMARKKLRRL